MERLTHQRHVTETGRGLNNYVRESGFLGLVSDLRWSFMLVSSGAQFAKRCYNYTGRRPGDKKCFCNFLFLSLFLFLFGFSGQDVSA